MDEKHEHPIDRLVRLGIHFNAFDLGSENGYWINFNKTEKCKHSLKSSQFREYPVTKLKECDICGMVSTPKRVSYRSDVYGWNKTHRKDFTTPSKNVLCMGCWNRVRAIVAKQDEADALVSLNRKLMKVIQNGKNQNNG